MMPEINGYEVQGALRQNSMTATIPFIFLTAMADKADIRRGMHLGADDYLTKPFTQRVTQLRRMSGYDKHLFLKKTPPSPLYFVLPPLALMCMRS